MTRQFNKIALIGHGRIGKAIKTLLEQTGYSITAFDTKPQLGTETLSAVDQSSGYFKTIIEPFDGVIAATPYNLNVPIARAAIESGKAYFDMTEDVKVSTDVVAIAEAEKEHNSNHGMIWVSQQCGLAPGAVNMIAKQLVDEFDSVTDINIRVGALPQTANNKMKYYLTWSSEGLVNEYCNPCKALVNGEQTSLQPLEGYEELIIDGLEYEAFNTSGGIGTLIETLQSQKSPVQNINYKTMRYKGHRSLMKFLFDDLGLSNRKELLVEVFNREVPHVMNDVVVIFVQVSGYKNGLYQAKTYNRKIYADANLTAIQMTTAAGLCTVVDYWANGSWMSNTDDSNHSFNIVSPEQIPAKALQDNVYWSLYSN